jgi:predicted double-glycine peptidase
MKYKRILKIFLFPILFWFTVFSVVGSGQTVEAGSFRVGGISVHKRVKSFKDLKFTNIVRQTRDYSCGAASLATILTYYIGRETSEEEVLNAILSNADDLKAERIKEKGLSLLDLKKYGESLGYRIKGYKLPDYHNITKLEVPAIVLVDHRGLSHFVVVKGNIGQDVFIADPARGNIKISLDEFGKIWGNILLICSKPNGEKIKSHALSLNRVKNKRVRLSNQVHSDMVRYVISSPLDFN